MTDAAASPDLEPVGKPIPFDRMRYMQSFHYVFESPSWITNVLFVGLCILSTGVIPILGQLVVQGYQFAIIEALYLRPGSRYPDFDMNKLIDYLVRGFWVFLVTLVIGLPILLVIGGLTILFIVLIASAGAAGGDDTVAVVIFVVGPILVCVVLAMLVAVNMICVPFMLRAGLLQDFTAAFDFGFAKQFIRNTWKEMILCALFATVASMLLLLVGTAMLCVGVYFTMSIAMLMQAHLVLQLYQLHLARGGDEIAIAAKAVPS